MINCFIVTVFIVIVLLSVYYLYNRFTSKEEKINITLKKSIYFQVIDKNGIESIIHDSGYDPSKKNVKFQILKKEINDRKSIDIDTPKIIKFGIGPTDLKNTIQVKDEDIEDLGEYYIVKAVL